nr:hypothetical protein [Tanacetum cinerariifolium]GEY28283.1 hypothetical protein [Tanacetum cinerariifolium]
MSVEDLVVRLHIEDDNKLAHKNTYIPDSAKTKWLCMLHHLQSPIPMEKTTAKGSNKKIKGKVEYLAFKVKIVKQNYQGLCYNCNQPGSNNKDWWVDIVATRHVYVDKSMFRSFKAIHNGEKLYMGNSATADIKGEGDVILKMICEGLLETTGIFACLAEKVMTRFPGYKTCWEPHAKNQQDHQGIGYAPKMFELQKDDEQVDHKGSHQSFSRVRKDECAKTMAERSHQNGTLL